MTPQEKIQKEIEKIQNNYKKQEEKQFFRGIIYGSPGTGKTFSLRTWPFSDDNLPNIHIDSFDPGGTKPLKLLIEQGKIIVDSSYENNAYDDNPDAFFRWSKDFIKRKKLGYYEQFDLLVIDSLSEMIITIEDWIIECGRRKDNREEFHFKKGDRGAERSYYYKILQGTIKAYLQLPCNIIMFAHSQNHTAMQDSKTKKITGGVDKKPEFMSIEAPSKMVNKIVRLVDELWWTLPRYGNNGIEKVFFRTTPSETIHAKSRFSSIYDLKPKQLADFTQIMEIIR